MKILIVSTSYPNSRNIASGKFVQNLAEALSVKSEVSSVDVIAPSVAGIKPAAVSQHGLSVRYFRYAPNPLETLAQLPGGIPAALRNRPFAFLLIPFFLSGMFISVAGKIRTCDAVLAQWSICGFVAGVLCALTGKTLITTLHGEDVRSATEKRIFRLLLKLAMNFSGKVVCVSQEMKELLLEMYPDHREKISYISNGISSDLFHATVSKPPATDTPLKIIMVGSLIPIKSIDHAVDALHRLVRERDYSIILTIVGDGYLRNELDAKIKNEKLESSVTLLGLLDHTALIDEYKKHDLLLITSKEEGRSTVVLEAMASGLTVVGSDVKGIREMLSESPGGLLYDYADIDKLCDLLGNIYLNREIAVSNGKKNREWIKQMKISWPEIADEYLSMAGG